MPFSFGSATSDDDFFTQLDAFMVANGWTQDQLNTTADEAAWHLSAALSATVAAGGTGYTVGDTLTLVGGTFTTAATFNVDAESGGVVTAVSVVVGGDYTLFPGDPVSTSGGTGTGATLNVEFRAVFVSVDWGSTPGRFKFHQALGFSGGAPGTHFADSGSGATRFVGQISTGPYIGHSFFTDASGSYIHVALEHATGNYRHFGFGTINKTGTWTGGEYLVAHQLGLDGGVTSDPFDNRHNFLFDARHVTNGDKANTMHLEGLPDQDASSKWGVFYVGSPTFRGNDTVGNARVDLLGGHRDGFLHNAFVRFSANPNSGFVPFFRIHVYIFIGVEFRFLGDVLDIAGVNMQFINVEEEFTIGADTWRVYPWVRKTNTGSQEESENMGIMYKKVP